MKKQTTWIQIAVASSAATLIFVIDLTVPLGVAVGVLYVLFVLTSLNLQQPRLTIFTGCLAVGLTLVGYIFSPEGGDQWKVILNRIISIAAVGGTTLLVLYQIRTQEKLAANEERLTLALEATDEGIWDWIDIKKEEEWWSPKFFSLLGFSPDEIPPSLSQFKALLHPQDQERTFTAIGKHLKEHTPFDLEYRLQTKSGEYRWFRGRGKAVQTPNEGQVRMIGSIDDITGRKQMEEVIRAKDHERRIILDNVPALIASFDAEHRYRFANKRYLEWFNHKPEALVGKHAKEFLSEEAYEGSIERRMNQALAGKVVNYEVQVPHHDGSLRWVEAIYVPDTDYKKNIQGFFAMVIDINKRKLYEIQVEYLSERLRLAQQSANLGVWDWDVVNNVLTWDDRMYALYGTTPDKFSGAYEAWTQGLHPEDDPKAQAELQAALDGQKPFNTEFRVIWPDRSIHWVKATAIVTHNAEGTPLRMIGMNWDITKSKEDEAVIREYTRELEISNQELDDFAYIASHDLKEPLRGIANYSRFLIEDHGSLLPEEGKEQCETIVKLTQRMENLIETLRHFSRLGRTELEWKTIDLEEVISDIAFTLKSRLEETQTTLRRPSPLPSWPCDATRIREVIANLITNAIKYNDKAEKWIEITAQTFHNPQRLTIAVQDNGIGIPEKHYKDVFRIYRRLHGRDKFGGGDGAGLAIVKKIIERHDGTIHLTSKVGVGSTFLLTLPFTQLATQENHPAPHSLSSNANSPD